MTTAADLARLVRLPAGLTVPGDSIAGAAAAGWPLGRRTAALPVASACLYWSGMALNDWADRGLDAVERPERPIPSGRVSPRLALGVGIGLTAGGLAAAAVAGRPALRVAVPLAMTVWSYDLLLKQTPLGPLAMASARGLDVMLGAGGARAAAFPALSMAAHTLALTQLSRSEVTGADPRTPAAALLTTAALALTVAGRPAPGGATALLPRAGAAAGAVAFAYAVGRSQFAAVQDPSASSVRRAVGAGISGMLPLQAALVARGGAPRTALVLAAALPLSRALARRVSST